MSKIGALSSESTNSQEIARYVPRQKIINVVTAMLTTFGGNSYDGYHMDILRIPDDSIILSALEPSDTNIKDCG